MACHGSSGHFPFSSTWVQGTSQDARLSSRGSFVPGRNSSSVVRFSVFELDLETGELRRNGQKVRLQEQPLQVLAALLEKRGGLVTREELRARLWPRDPFAVLDHGINASIKGFRKRLANPRKGRSLLKPLPNEAIDL